MRSFSAVSVVLTLVACGGSEFSSGGQGGGGSGGSGGSTGGEQSGGANSSGGDSMGGTGGSGGSGTGGDASGGGGSGAMGGSDGGSSGSSAGSSSGGGGSSSTGGSHATGGTGGSGGSGATGGQGASAGSGGNSGSGGTGAPDPIRVCPMNPPPLNAPCVKELVCTYGDDPRLSCRATYRCKDDGSGFIASDAQCEEAADCVDRDRYPEPVVAGTSCEDRGDTCWLGGVTCVCEFDVSGQAGDTGTWNCVVAEPPCPEFPPNLGQACSGEVNCSYATCASQYYTQVACDGGTWRQQDVVCPGE